MSAPTTNKLHKHTSNLLYPDGAYTSLASLQRLRQIANFIALNKKKANVVESSGQHKSRALSRGMEFEEVRIYQAGDDVRNIDWRVTARTQTTHTKCFRDEKEKPVITLVDQRRSLFFGSQHCFKSVYACELAAVNNWATLKRGDRSGGLVLASDTIHETRPARSQKAINQWLQLLNNANNSIDLHSKLPEPHLNEALQQLQRIAKSGTECIIISDFYDVDAETEKQLYILARHNPVRLYWLVDPLEISLPIVQDVTLSNGEQKQIFSIDKHIQTQQSAQFKAKSDFLSNLSIRLNINLLQVTTDQPLNNVVSQQNRY